MVLIVSYDAIAVILIYLIIDKLESIVFKSAYIINISTCPII